MNPKTISLDKWKIGSASRCFIAAEIGINHNGDMQLAKNAIMQAKACGADAVKFQNFRAEDFVPDRSLKYSYISEGREVTESQYDMFKRYELSFSQLQELKQFCDQQEIFFFSTPTSIAGVEDLVKLNVKLLKNGSDALSNLELLAYMAKTGIPLVISTGMATFSEIAEAVEAIEAAGGRELIILRCVSNYPAAAESLNLLQIDTLKSLGYLVGFSDHSEGSQAASLAVALGACFIEKHFTIDKNLPGPDHRFSMDPKELRELVQSIRTTEIMLGSNRILPTELATKQGLPRQEYRLSVGYSCALSAGTVLEPAHLGCYRPGGGFPPKFLKEFAGHKLCRNVNAGKMLTLNDFKSEEN